MLSANLTRVAERALRQTMVGSGTRRLMVSTWVRALQLFRESGIRPLSEEDTDRLMEGAKEQLNASEATAVVTEGE